MKQYSQMKAKYPETILLFRLGDFYETFEEDAGVTSRVLGLTLTRRNNGAAGDIPLAGFPHHALDAYLPKLLRAGYRVAICEQLEDPRFAKGLVKRDVTEIVTPGIAYSDKILETKENNYLLAVALPTAVAAADEIVGIAFADVSTGEFRIAELPFRELAPQIASLQPSEIVVQKRDRESLQSLLRTPAKSLFTKLDDWIFNYDYAYELLIGQLRTQTLKGFGLEDFHIGVIAAGAVMNYLQETQKANLGHIRKIVPYFAGDHIMLDAATKRNLEISRSIEGRQEGTLFWVLDRTRTPMGGRLLNQWINHPLRRVDPIRERLSAVEATARSAGLRNDLLSHLSRIGDLERLVSKICTNRANPREVYSLKDMLTEVSALREILGAHEEHPHGAAPSPTLTALKEQLRPLPHIVSTIASALEHDPPLALADGGVIRKGFNSDLDELRDSALHGKTWIANLQKTERDRTGISSLKIGFNNVFGYYIEITNAHKTKVPPERYIRKQTLTNAERYVTPELKEVEEKVLHAEEKILALETELFNALRNTIAEEAGAIQQNAGLVAMLDCFTALAEVAVEHRYCMPVVDEGTAISITAGRHPVIERLLPPGESYTPNDVRLDTGERQILVITGPNMSGKSSYLRQAGLIVLLAQIGSFVPAKEAQIGVVDRIYTRVGASDNIASGESTFLVEMHEAANILNTATPRSLVLLDEVGRGTSTFDGISIAWALTEYLHERVGAKTLFATHYHELNELADLFPRVVNMKVDVREYGDKVIFLHTVTPGSADHSYGIQVAQMAGLPAEVTDRARQILKNLESSDLVVHGGRQMSSTLSAPESQLALFEIKDDKLRDELRGIDVDTLTPLEALQKLAEFKRKLEK